jgi:hypothetical protein
VAADRFSELVFESLAQLGSDSRQSPAQLAYPAGKPVDQVSGTQIPSDARVRDNFDMNLILTRHVDPFYGCGAPR